MPADARDTVTWVLGTLISLCVLAGLVVRFVLMPYLRDHLVGPVREVQKQVSENHHANDPPTIPDRIEDMHAEVRALTVALDGHLVSSERWLDYILRRLDGSPPGHDRP